MAVKNSDGTWKELLFMDTDDAETAVNVLRINENGIGFSRNGINGPYTQAWTMDGKLIIGGTNVPSFSVMNESIEVLKIDKNAITWKDISTGKKALEVRGNQLQIRSWNADDNERWVGILGNTRVVRQDGSILRTAALWCQGGEDDENNVTGVGLGFAPTNGGVYYALRFTKEMDTNNDTPYIIHTANGTLFPNNQNGGITIQNGLVKNWNLYGLNGDFSGITRIKVEDGLVVGYSRESTTYSGYISVGGQIITVSDGLITGVT
jgi:hypothetical protein